MSTFWTTITKAGRSLRGRFSSGSVTTHDPVKLAELEAAAARHGETVVVHTLADPGGARRDAGNTIVAEARRDLGKHEDPPNSNWGPFVQVVLATAGWHSPAPWCCAWATMIVNRLARSIPGVLSVLATAGCGSLREWAQAHGRYSQIPRVGDIGLLAHDEHATIVTAVMPDGSVATIAGNTSLADGSNYNGGNVAEHHYPRSAFEGFVITH